MPGWIPAAAVLLQPVNTGQLSIFPMSWVSGETYTGMSPTTHPPLLILLSPPTSITSSGPALLGSGFLLQPAGPRRWIFRFPGAGRRCLTRTRRTCSKLVYRVQAALLPGRAQKDASSAATAATTRSTALSPTLLAHLNWVDFLLRGRRAADRNCRRLSSWASPSITISS